MAQEKCKSVIVDNRITLPRIVSILDSSVILGEDFHPSYKEGEPWCECPMCRKNIYNPFNFLERNVQIETFNQTYEIYMQLVRMLNHRLTHIHPEGPEAIRITKK